MVSTRTAADRIVAVFAVDLIIPDAGDDVVVSKTAKDGVVAGLAVEVIGV